MIDDIISSHLEKAGIIALLVGVVSAFAKRMVVPRSAYDELLEDRDEWVSKYRELVEKIAFVQQALQDRRQR